MRPLEVNELPHCAACGQLTTWKMRNKEFFGRSLLFCGQHCVSVFDDYLLPTYGASFVKKLDKTCDKV